VTGFFAFFTSKYFFLRIFFFFFLHIFFIIVSSSPSGVAAAQHSCAAWLDCSSHDGVTLRFAAIGPTTGGALAAVEGG
jgi:hypothetical protein